MLACSNWLTSGRGAGRPVKLPMYQSSRIGRRFDAGFESFDVLASAMIAQVEFAGGEIGD